MPVGGLDWQSNYVSGMRFGPLPRFTVDVKNVLPDTDWYWTDWYCLTERSISIHNRARFLSWRRLE